MKKKSWIIVGVLIVLGLLCWLLFGRTKKEVVTLESAPTSRVNIVNSVTATGTVKPVTEVVVGTQVSGIINNLYADYNDEVKAGQLLAEMDKITLEAEYESALTEQASAKTEYDYQLKTYNRTKELHEKNLVSDAEYDQALYSYEKAYNAYKQSNSAIVKAKRNLGYATITSPIDGIVINRAVEEGQTVAAGFETPTLFTIAKDLTQMQVIADVDEADIGQVKEGLRVQFTVDAFPDDLFEGEVKQVRLEATTTSNVVTYEVVVTAPNPELKLKPGLTANIRIFTLEKDNVLAVPTRALRFNPDAELLNGLGISFQPYRPSSPDERKVWVKSGSELVAVPVVTGYVSGDMTEIVEGLRDGQEVATTMNVVSEKAEPQTERSPFMPGPPGSDKKQKK